ncbi:MAG: RidA family protein [Parvularcula sp.]
MHAIEQRLKDEGLTLPEPAAPVASYTPFVIHQHTLYISGQLPFSDGKIITGLCGQDLAIEAGIRAARCCALMLLAQAKSACGGDLSRLDRCLKLTGFVACSPDFTEHPTIINGASDLIGAAMGEAGIHARAAVGVSSLPLGAAVEIEAIFSLKQ